MEGYEGFWNSVTADHALMFILPTDARCCLIICFTIAALFISACRLSYADLEGIFLIAAHVSITHEKQCVGVGTG